MPLMEARQWLSVSACLDGAIFQEQLVMIDPRAVRCSQEDRATRQGGNTFQSKVEPWETSSECVWGPLKSGEESLRGQKNLKLGNESSANTH